MAVTTFTLVSHLVRPVQAERACSIAAETSRSSLTLRSCQGTAVAMAAAAGGRASCPVVLEAHAAAAATTAAACACTEQSLRASATRCCAVSNTG